MKLAKFISGDGVPHEVSTESVAFAVMSKDASFTRLDQPEIEETTDTTAKVEEKPLSRMNRVELVAEAEKRGLEIPEDFKKAQILAAIEEKDAAAPTTDPAAAA